MAGWSKDADRIYLYDRYDLWEVDPEGSVKPRNLTNGRSSKTVYRVQGIDSDIRHIDTANLYLTVFNERTKDAGFARLQGRELDRLAYGPKQFVFGGKAKNAETTLWREGTAVDYPELRVGTLAFTNGKVLTDTNPQKKDYNWLTSELVTWRSGDGEELQGVIFKPENFDPTKKYPMIAYFYEKDSDLLHLFRNPAPSADTVPSARGRAKARKGRSG